jgi:hypothetical protein
MITSFPLLGYNEVVHTIYQIERELSGWWYSLSQNSDGVIRLSLGPSQSCYDSESRYLLSIRDGGYILPTNIESFRSVTSELLEELRAELNEIHERDDGELIPFMRLPRLHDTKNVPSLIVAYENITRAIQKINTSDPDNYQIDEILIGSCHESADVSIRGRKFLNEVECAYFDISIDIHDDDGTIDKAINIALNDFEFMVKMNTVIHA